MIDQLTISRILDASPIVDVVGQYVTLRRSGASYKGLCPFHDDKTPSFYVNPARGVCKCFSCGKGGNVVGFIMEQETLNYVDALKFLARRAGIEVKEKELTEEDRRAQNERESMFAVNEWACRYFSETMQSTEDGRAIGLAYFRARGFRDDIIQKFQLGFCLDTWDTMSQAAIAKGYKADFLVATGLSTKRDNGTLIDKFRGRAIFPWINQSGRVVGFGGRVLDSRTKGVNQKYINSPASAIYDKSRELYGIFQAKKQISKENLVYMVEGYTDVISMHQCGIENVVANSGTALTHPQIQLLKRLTSNVTLLYDGDAAGVKAALRGTDMFLAEGMNVKVLLLPDGQDPDEFARQHTSEEFREYVKAHQTDFILFKVQLLLAEAGRDPRKRSELATNMLQSICVIPQEIVRSSYIHECAEQMNMSENMLLRECNRMRRRYLEEQNLERQREAERRERLTEQQPQADSDGASLPPPAHATSLAPPPEEGTDMPSAPLPDLPTDLLPPHDTPTPSGDFSSLPDGLVPPPEPRDERQPQLPDELLGAAPAQTQAANRFDSELERAFSASPSSKLTEIELLILREVLRYGSDTILTAAPDGTDMPIPLAQFVADQLAIDGLTFSLPLHTAVLHTALDAISRLAAPTPDGHTASADASQPTEVEARQRAYMQAFTYNADLHIAHLASDLLSERYQLSKLMQTGETTDIGANISHLMLDYKLEILNVRMAALQREIKQDATAANPQRAREIFKEMADITRIKRAMSDLLGQRIM